MIKIEITADTAEALATQLRTFVDTFVKLAKDSEPGFENPVETPRDEAPEPEAPKAEAPRKPRAKKAPVIDGEVTPPVGADNDAAEEVTPDQVRAVLNKLRAEKGNDILGRVVTQFAPKFSEIPETSYAQLYAVAKRHLEAA
jgi:hypothetical protein